MSSISKRKNCYTLSQISEIESKYNIIFPKVLRKYYLTYGNSEIKKCLFEINGFLSDIAEFVSIDNDDKMSLSHILDQGRSDGWIPDDFYPFAYDSGGNYYFWNAKNGEIYLIFNDDVDNPYKICDSMKELFKLIKK